jgi:hypothetical protein
MLNYMGTTDTRARKGSIGTLLLHPNALFISNRRQSIPLSMAPSSRRTMSSFIKFGRAPAPRWTMGEHVIEGGPPIHDTP